MTMKTAALYARYSTDRQDKTSCLQQLRECREFAQREGFKVIAEFSDAAVSGSDDARPEYRRMLTASDAGEFDVIIACAPDRLTRNEWELPRLVADLSFKDQQLLTCDRKIDSRSENASPLAGLHGGISAEEKKKGIARTRRGLRERFIENLSTGGVAYGYKSERLFPDDPDNRRARLAVDGEKASMVLRVFSEYAAGCSPFTIASRLNEDGVAAPGATWARTTRRKDAKWQKTAVRELLDNERYIGRVIFNRHEWRKDPKNGKRRCRERPREEWMIREEAALRIVPDALWQRVRARRSAIRANSRQIVFDTPKGRRVASRGGVRRKYLFSGILKCADCGASLVMANAQKYACGSHVNGGPHACAHSRRYNREFAEDVLLQTIQHRLLTPERVARFTQRLRARPAAAPVDPAARIRALDAQIDRYIEAIGAGAFSPALRAKLEAAEAEKARVLAAPPPRTSNVTRLVTDGAAKYREMVGELAAWLRKDPEKAAHILGALFQAIPVTPEGKATVTLDTRKILSLVGCVVQVGSGGRISHTPTRLGGVRICTLQALGSPPAWRTYKAAVRRAGQPSDWGRA
jgi:site-specific DNA recombinase